MIDYTITITQNDIDTANNAVLINHALSITNCGMAININKIIDDENAVICVVFEIKENEDQDDQNIYNINRIIAKERID